MGLTQQRPQFSQFMINKYAVNPAYGGLERSLSVFTSFRDQNSSFPGNPQTFYLGADMPFYLWNGAIGFNIHHQKIGVFSNSNLKVSYNYVIGTQVGFLSLGGRIGMDFLSVNSLGITTPEGDYEGGLNHNDLILDNQNFSGAGLSWELGAYFMGSNIEAGITLLELPSHGYTIGSAINNRASNIAIFGQYKFDFNEEIELLPSFQLKADLSVIQADFGLTAKFDKNLLIGTFFRGYSKTSIDAVSVIVGTNIGRKYNIYYSYDFGLSALRTYHQGSHELTLSYNLQKLIGLGLPPNIIYNPRDL